MSKDKLPLALVEKFTPLLETYKKGNQTGYVQGKCAKIAVDYAKPFKDALSKFIGYHQDGFEELKSIKKQRDELVECMKLAMNLQRKNPGESLKAYDEFMKIATSVFKERGYDREEK